MSVNEDERASAIISSVRGVLGSIVAAWYVTALVLFWFALRSDAAMVLLWLAIQFGLLAALAVFGWGHLVHLWTGRTLRDTSLVYGIVWLMVLGVPVVGLAHLVLFQS